MSCIIFAMMEENCIISEQRPKTRLVIYKPLRYTDVRTVAAVNTKQNVCINMMLKKIQRKIKS